MWTCHIALFLQIVEKGSLVAAGREAGLSLTTVSERLAALEAHYRVVLLNRTTRAISLTDEGRTLVRQWGLAGHGIILKSELDVGQLALMLMSL